MRGEIVAGLAERPAPDRPLVVADPGLVERIASMGHPLESSREWIAAADQADPADPLVQAACAYSAQLLAVP